MNRGEKRRRKKAEKAPKKTRPGQETIPFPEQLKSSFLEDIEAQSLDKSIRDMGKALLVFHSPVDDIVDIGNARRIYEAARHPKSFVCLDGADHMLTDRADAYYVAEVISAWANRYNEETA